MRLKNSCADLKVDAAIIIFIHCYYYYYYNVVAHLHKEMDKKESDVAQRWYW